MARSVGWLVLTLTIALLTEPACAAGKIELVCKGTMEIHPSKPEPFEGAVILDLDKKTVTGFDPWTLKIDEITEKECLSQ